MIQNEVMSFLLIVVFLKWLTDDDLLNARTAINGSFWSSKITCDSHYSVKGQMITQGQILTEKESAA